MTEIPAAKRRGFRERATDLMWVGGVIVVFAILIGAVLAGINVRNKHVTIVDETTFQKQLEVAIGQYRQIYSALPFTLEHGTDSDLLIDDHARYQTLLDTLEGQDRALNPRKQKFLELDKNGEYRDGFGNDFIVVLDLEGDGDLEHPRFTAGRSPVPGTIAIYSRGEDGDLTLPATDLSQPANRDNRVSWLDP